MEKVVLLDNGAGKIKYGIKHGSNPAVVEGSMPNHIAKINKQMTILIGDDTDNILDGSLLQYTRPFDRGYVNNWGCELDIWSKIFNEKLGLRSFSDVGVVVTEPPLNPAPWQDDYNEIVFEYYGFHSYTRRPASWFSLFNFSSSSTDTYNSCGLVIDSGFSFSHAFPFIDGKCQKGSIRRVNIGGKILTNYLKELLSYRQWNMMDEFRMMDQVKEDLCFVSMDICQDLKNSRMAEKARIMAAFSNENQRKTSSRPKLVFNIRPKDTNDASVGILKRRFVLPDYQSIMKGFVKDESCSDSPEEQLLILDTERISVPELLFRPSDIGIDSAGISEASSQCVNSLPSEIEQALVCRNIILTGGSTKFSGFEKRFCKEFRMQISDNFECSFHIPSNPEYYPIEGACKWIDQVFSSPHLWNSSSVSRQEYIEYGHDYCNEKFYNLW